MNKTDGSTNEFDINWRERKETFYNHWTKGIPKNQIQLAFRKHWEVFNEIIQQDRGKSLEVGCGRGSMSSYFAHNGWDATLLDSSLSILNTAKHTFAANSQQANFVAGNASDLNFPDNTFDVVFSIGLLEHFKDINKPITEQWRVLKPGGWFLGYIVPEIHNNIQRYFGWLNKILKLMSFLFVITEKNILRKEPVYRSTFNSQYYLNSINHLNIDNLLVYGMYPLPMISHSPDFPFSLLPGPIEFVITRLFELILFFRKSITGRHGWICSEKTGQAFLIAFQKPFK